MQCIYFYIATSIFIGTHFFVTAHKVQGKVLFSQVSVCSHFVGGVPHPMSRWGVSHPADRGVPHPTSRWEEVPIQLIGDTPSQVQMGVSHPADRGYPHPVDGGPHPRSRGYPHPGLDEVPCPIQDWMGYPSPGQSSIVNSTYYMTGGMPLAFMQEDFLVFYVNISWNHIPPYCQCP